jgi:hypothetical protein
MSMILVLGLLPLVLELVLVVVVHLWTLGEIVSSLAALEASPRVPPHVHAVLVQPLVQIKLNIDIMHLTMMAHLGKGQN